MNLHRSLISFAVAMFLPCIAFADVLFSVTRQIDDRVFYGVPREEIVEEVGFGLGFAAKPDPFPPVSGGSIEALYTNRLLEVGGISALDDGTVYTATRASDPDFAAVAALLTNGIDDLIVTYSERYGIALDGEPTVRGWTYSASEEARFFELPGAPDLAGSDVQSISVRFDDLQFVPFVDGTREGKRIHGSYTVTFEGVLVPEPGGISCIALAALLTARRRRRV